MRKTSAICNPYITTNTTTNSSNLTNCFDYFDFNYFMAEAIKLANYGQTLGEIPVGAVVVYNSKIIGQGFNQPITTNDPSAHAEIVAIRAAAKYLNNYRLTDCVLYVTLQPCAMCTGAILHARIKQVIFGAFDPKKDNNYQNHNFTCLGGILETECKNIMLNFFKAKRQKIKDDAK